MPEELTRYWEAALFWKSFYLELPASMNLQFLTGAIQQLGGVPASRGKELLQKAVRNQGSSSRGGSGSSSSLLANARSWGVRILHVDEMMMHVQQLSLGSLCVKKQEPKKPEGTCPAVESRTWKVARLKVPFLKVEDESRKFRPFHYQFKSFPKISFLRSKNASPFEAQMTPGSSHHTREPKDQVPSLQSATCTVPRRKKGYCECCQEAFEELHVHLQSAQHWSFALKAHPYAEVDRIIAQLSHSFTDIAFQASLPRQSGSPASECDPPCAETLSPSLPSQSRAASSRMKKEDNCQAAGTPEQAATVDSMKAPAEPVGAGKVPAPGASCQELGESVDMFVDLPGTPLSRSPARQCLLTSSGCMDFSSGPDLALVGHKRKVQFPSDNAEKRPGGHRPHFLYQESPSPAASGQPMAGIFSPFLFQAVSPGPQPPSCPCTTHRAASLSQIP